MQESDAADESDSYARGLTAAGGGGCGCRGGRVGVAASEVGGSGVAASEQVSRKEGFLEEAALELGL